MNIIEAIKSGKPFRRKAWPSNREFQDNIGGYCLGLTECVDDLLADDWEVKEKDHVTICYEDFSRAYSAAIMELQYRHKYSHIDNCVELVSMMAAHLGLKKP